MFWAAGNGASDGDNCAMDETNSSPTIITVGAINSEGVKSSYSEECANVFVSAPSDDVDTQGIRTTTIGNSCTDEFGGNKCKRPIITCYRNLFCYAISSWSWCIDVGS